MVFSVRPLPALFSFHSLFRAARILRSWAISCLVFRPPALGSCHGFFGLPRIPVNFPGFSAARPPGLSWSFRPSRISRKFPGYCLVFRVVYPWVLRWFFSGPEKLGKFPAGSHGFFGCRVDPGVSGPWAFHGFFGSPGPPQDPRILANFWADFRPAQPSSARISRNFQGGFDC